MSLEDLAKASQRMTEKDFPQFDDPRVREVMAAAANLVEAVNTQHPLQDVDGPMVWLKKVPLNTARDVCVAALFAAQHSKPKVWPCPTKPGKICTAAKCDWGCKT